MKVANWILKRKLLLICLMAVMFTANGQNAAYIAKHKTLATSLSEKYGIPYSVILGVAIVESSAGHGPAAKKLNNHFGIVGRNHLQAKGYHSRYKQYTSAQASFTDFCKMISRKDFYESMKNNTDPKAWIAALSRAGYSEEPQVWEKRILNTIATNKL